MAKSFVFEDIHSLGELQGNILNVLEKRVRRRLESDLVAWAVYIEAQALLKKFFPDPLAFDSHSRGQNAWLLQMEKLVKVKPDISYLQYLLQSLINEVENEPAKK